MYLTKDAKEKLFKKHGKDAKDTGSSVLWLKNNTYTTTIVKWETKAWGEIPADFGRK